MIFQPQFISCQFKLKILLKMPLTLCFAKIFIIFIRGLVIRKQGRLFTNPSLLISKLNTNCQYIFFLTVSAVIQNEESLHKEKQ